MSKLQDTVKRLRDTADELECLYKDTAKNDLKSELLRHYAHCDPVAFCQVDGFANVEPGDFFMAADSDKHCVISSEAYELRRSDHAVRLQIREGTPPKEAVALVQKMLSHVKRLAKDGGTTAFGIAGEKKSRDIFDADFIPF